MAIVPCPRDATGLAHWACVANPNSPFFPDWASGQPDLSNCRSNRMTNLADLVRKEDPVEVIVSSLAKLTADFDSLYGGDVELASSILRAMANRLQYKLQSQGRSFFRKEDYVQNNFQNILRSVSHLFNRETRAAWMDLRESQRMKAATGLLVSLEENAFLLADVLAEKGEQYLVEASEEIGKKYTFCGFCLYLITFLVNFLASFVRSIDFLEADKTGLTGLFYFSVMAASIRRVSQLNSNDSSYFPLNGDNAFARIFGPIADKIEVPAANLKEGANHVGFARVVFFSFKSLHDLLSSAERALAPNLEQTRFEWRINSRVISASVSKGRHTQLAAPVEVTLGHLRATKARDEENVCVFWDFEMSAWSDEGCEVVIAKSDEAKTVCKCDHLTSFAILTRKVSSTAADSASEGDNYYAFLALEILGYVALVVVIVIISCLLYKVEMAFLSLLLTSKKIFLFICSTANAYKSFPAKLNVSAKGGWKAASRPVLPLAQRVRVSIPESI